MHYQCTIGHAKDFLHFTGDKQDGDAFAREFFHELIYFAFGADINSPGGFIQH